MSPQSPTHEIPILVTGGTGTLGSLVVDRLLKSGKHVRVLSRGHRPAAPAVEHATSDLNTGAGVDAAMKDIQIVLHLAGTQKGDDVRARNLLAAAKAASVQHIVFISVVGADRIPVESAIDRSMFAYYAAKRAAEELIEKSGVPWTTLRSTQVDQSFLKLFRAMTKLPIIPVPSGWKSQPIDGEEVADRLVDLAAKQPAGYVHEIGGPKVYEFAELLRIYLRAMGKRRMVIGMPTPGAAARILKDGANLTPDHAQGQSWEQFLAAQLQTRTAQRHVSETL